MKSWTEKLEDKVRSLLPNVNMILPVDEEHLSWLAIVTLTTRGGSELWEGTQRSDQINKVFINWGVDLNESLGVHRTLFHRKMGASSIITRLLKGG